jgi:hypothetical protein
LRWGRDWFDRSLEHLCTTWGLDRRSDEWARHDEYPTFVRRRALTRWRPVNAVLDHGVAPVDHVVAQRWDAGRA